MVKEDAMDEGVLIIVDGDVTKVELETLMVGEVIEEVMKGVFEGVVPDSVVDFLEVVSEDGIIVDVIVFVAVEGTKEDGIFDPFCVVVEEIEIDDIELTGVVVSVKSDVVETCFGIVTTLPVSLLDVSLKNDIGLDAVDEVLVKAVGVEPILDADEKGIIEVDDIEVVNDIE